MPSRRALLTTLGAAAIAESAGCIGQIRRALDDEIRVEGACDDSTQPWPTAGGDPGRTGRTETAMPSSNADVVNLLAGVREDDQQLLASSLPAVADRTAYIPASGTIVALNLESPADGPAWIHDFNDDMDATPALACGAVLAPGLNHLAALDPATGEAYWQTDGGSTGDTTVGVLGETVYTAGVTPTAIDIRTGDVQWHVEGGDTVAVDEYGVYTTRNANGTGGIFAHTHKGEERWHLSLGKIVGSASVHDGTVWVAVNDGTVYAIDALTGETQWSRSLDGVEKVHSGLAVRGNDLVVPAGTGSKSVILAAASGETRWTVDTGIVTGRPVVGDDWVAFGRTNVGVTVYSRETGAKRVTWSREKYGFGTVDGLVPVEDGFLVRGGTTSGLSLIR